MDKQTVDTGRGVRNVKVVVSVAVAVFVVAIILSFFGGGRRFAHDDARKGMMSPGIARTEMSTGALGNGIEPMMYAGKQAAVAPDMPMMNDASVSTDGGNSSLADEVKVVKTADMNLKVESTEKAVADVRGIAERLGGSILNSSLSDVTTSVPNGDKSGMVAMRVPIDRFEEALQDIRSVARVVVYESTNSQDVSREYVDLQARLKNKQKEEESIAAILNRETNKIDDVLRVTVELARVRGEIEQLQAQVKYMDSQTDMSTITVSFTEDARVGGTTSGWRPSQDAKDAVNALIKAGQRMASFLISFVIAVLPILIVVFALFGALLYVVVKKLYRWLNR